MYLRITVLQINRLLHFFRVVSRYSPAAQQRLLTNLELLNDLSTFLTIADVI